jgi:hypothetical protein
MGMTSSRLDGNYTTDGGGDHNNNNNNNNNLTVEDEVFKDLLLTLLC